MTQPDSGPRLQHASRRALLVGDGVNDAPWLTADVGVAMDGAGADLALQAADAVVVRVQAELRG